MLGDNIFVSDLMFAYDYIYQMLSIPKWEILELLLWSFEYKKGDEIKYNVWHNTRETLPLAL